jgi:hypothetical protein
MIKKVLVFAALALLAIPSFAQTNSAPSSTDSFLGDVEQYLTSFSTNTWNGKGYVETGALFEHKLNVGNFLEAGVDLKDLTTNMSLYSSAEAVNAVALGPTQEATVSLGLGYKIHDVQLMLSAGPGYDWASKSPVGQISFQLQKKMTARTFSGLGAAQYILGKSSNTRVFLLAGFTF